MIKIIEKEDKKFPRNTKKMGHFTFLKKINLKKVKIDYLELLVNMYKIKQNLFKLMI